MLLLVYLILVKMKCIFRRFHKSSLESSIDITFTFWFLSSFLEIRNLMIIILKDDITFSEEVILYMIKGCIYCIIALFCTYIMYRFKTALEQDYFEFYHGVNARGQSINIIDTNLHGSLDKKNKFEKGRWHGLANVES